MSVGGFVVWFDDKVLSYFRKFVDSEFFVRGTIWSLGCLDDEKKEFVDIVGVNGFVFCCGIKRCILSEVLVVIVVIVDGNYELDDIVTCL